MADPFVINYENETNEYSYISFPNVVIDIWINGLEQQFNVAENDMGTIIKSLKHICVTTFDDVPNSEIIVTDSIINENDINDDIKVNTKRILDVFNMIFDNMSKFITKQCHNCGETNEPVIISHIMYWFKDLCIYIQETIMKHYFDLILMNYTLRYLTKTVFDEKDLMLSNDTYITYMKKQNTNIVKIRSFQPTKYVKVLYKDNNNNLKIANKILKHKYYMINVKSNTCSCPDFIHRKSQNGLVCKHLIELKNKTRCLLLLKSIQNKNLYNVNMPMKEMLNQVYTEDIKY